MNKHFQAQGFKFQLTRELQERRKILLTGAPCGPIRPLSPGIPLGPLKKEKSSLFRKSSCQKIKWVVFLHSCRSDLSCPIAENK